MKCETKRPIDDPGVAPVRYPNQQTAEPGLVGGPATSSVPSPDPNVIDEVVEEIATERTEFKPRVEHLEDKNL